MFYCARSRIALLVLQSLVNRPNSYNPAIFHVEIGVKAVLILGGYLMEFVCDSIFSFRIERSTVCSIWIIEEYNMLFICDSVCCDPFSSLLGLD